MRFWVLSDTVCLTTLKELFGCFFYYYYYVLLFFFFYYFAKLIGFLSKKDIGHIILKHKTFNSFSLCYILKRNDMSTTFLQQILSGKLLLVVIVRAKK